MAQGNSIFVGGNDPKAHIHHFLSFHKVCLQWELKLKSKDNCSISCKIQLFFLRCVCLGFKLMMAALVLNFELIFFLSKLTPEFPRCTVIFCLFFQELWIRTDVLRSDIGADKIKISDKWQEFRIRTKIHKRPTTSRSLSTVRQLPNFQSFQTKILAKYWPNFSCENSFNHGNNWRWSSRFLRNFFLLWRIF